MLDGFLSMFDVSAGDIQSKPCGLSSLLLFAASFALKVTKKETTVDEWFFTYPVRKPSERQLGKLLGDEHGDRKEVVNLKVQVFVHPCRLVYGSPKWFEITQLTI